MSFLTLVYQTDPGVILCNARIRPSVFPGLAGFTGADWSSEDRMESARTYRRILFLLLCIESVEFILVLCCSAIVRTGCYNCPGLRLCALMYCCI